MIHSHVVISFGLSRFCSLLSTLCSLRTASYLLSETHLSRTVKNIDLLQESGMMYVRASFSVSFGREGVYGLTFLLSGTRSHGGAGGNRTPPLLRMPTNSTLNSA